jgi:hypothetical protein
MRRQVFSSKRAETEEFETAFVHRHRVNDRHHRQIHNNLDPVQAKTSAFLIDLV